MKKMRNLQGVRTSITDQKQKNADNAPPCASWLLIRATRGSKVLATRSIWAKTIRPISTSGPTAITGSI